MTYVSDWTREQKAAYAKGIEKGQRLAGENERDRIARAALMGLLAKYGTMSPYSVLASDAYAIADAMLKEKNRDTYDEIPF